jgi:hypothetical protein
MQEVNENKSHQKGPGKLHTDCKKEQFESLECLTDNPLQGKQVCTAYFEAYRACRAKEHERNLEKNKSKSSFF